MAQRATVLIADNRPRARQALAALLVTWPSAIVIGETGDGREAVRLAHELRPDVVLLDVRMPGVSGIEAAAQIKASCPATRVVLLSMYPECDEQARVAGADAFLAKADAPQLLLPLLARLMAAQDLKTQS